MERTLLWYDLLTQHFLVHTNLVTFCFDQESPIGYIPKKESFHSEGLDVNYEKLFDIPQKFWLDECAEIRKYFDEQVGADLPQEIHNQVEQLEARLKK